MYVSKTFKIWKIIRKLLHVIYFDNCHSIVINDISHELKNYNVNQHRSWGIIVLFCLNIEILYVVFWTPVMVGGVGDVDLL